MVRTGWMDHERWTTDAKTKVMGIIGGKKKKDTAGKIRRAGRRYLAPNPEATLQS